MADNHNGKRLKKHKDGENVNSAKVIQVIETKSTRGKGTDADPVREITQYWDFEGNLICEKDSCDIK